MKKLVSVCAAVLALAACSGEDDDTTGARITLSPDIAIHLSQDRYELVGEIWIKEPQLFRTPSEWRSWYWSEIPSGVRILPRDMAEPSFDSTVAIAGSYGSCTETSYLTVVDGEISFHISTDDPDIMCYWSPNQFYVYEVPLEDLGVDSADELTINPEYVRN